MNEENKKGLIAINSEIGPQLKTVNSDMSRAFAIIEHIQGTKEFDYEEVQAHLAIVGGLATALSGLANASQTPLTDLEKAGGYAAQASCNHLSDSLAILISRLARNHGEGAIAALALCRKSHHVLETVKTELGGAVDKQIATAVTEHDKEFPAPLVDITSYAPLTPPATAVKSTTTAPTFITQSPGISPATAASTTSATATATYEYIAPPEVSTHPIAATLRRVPLIGAYVDKIESRSAGEPISEAVLNKIRTLVATNQADALDEFLKALPDNSMRKRALNLPIALYHIGYGSILVQAAYPTVRQGDSRIYSPAVFQTLLKHGASPDNAIDKKESALLALCKTHKYSPDLVQCAKLLVAAGSEVDKKNDYYLNTALHYVVIHSGNDVDSTTRQLQEELIGLLISAGANVNAKNKDGDTPAHLAAAAGDAQIVALLAKNGADLTIKNKKRVTVEGMATNVATMTTVQSHNENPVPNTGTVDGRKNIINDAEGNAVPAPHLPPAVAESTRELLNHVNADHGVVPVELTSQERNDMAALQAQACRSFVPSAQETIPWAARVSGNAGQSFPTVTAGRKGP